MQLGRLAQGVVAHGVHLHVVRAVRLTERVDGALQRGAQHGVGQHHLAARRRHRLGHFCVQHVPRRTGASEVRPLKACAVVQAHHRSVHTHVGMADPCGGVALDEDGTALAGLDQHVHVVLTVVVGRGVVVGHTRGHFFRLVGVRDALDHRGLARGQCGGGQGEAHELQEVTTACGGRSQALVAERLINGFVLREFLTLEFLESLRLVQVVESRPVAFVVRHVHSNLSWLLVAISSGTWRTPNHPFL